MKPILISAALYFFALIFCFFLDFPSEHSLQMKTLNEIIKLKTVLNSTVYPALDHSFITSN